MVKLFNPLLVFHNWRQEQGNKQVKDNKIDLFVQKYEEFVISDDETIDCAFARFNTIIASLKAPDESFSSRNHVRKSLRALPTKWRPKVTTIEESKDLSTLPLDELIGNLKVYEVVIEKDSEASKIKKEKYKSLALKARKISSDKEDDMFGDKIGPKHSFNDQKAFVEGCWSDSEDEAHSKDEICLMALDNNELIIDVAQVSGVGDIVSTASAATTVSAATTTTATIKTVEDITLAQALEEMKSTKPKKKGDKGKGILIEPMKPINKKNQIRLDEEIALNLQVEFDEEERLTREKLKKKKKPILP
ncbi:hypothetical protein Tco_0143706 [Tanacetum coccineum]